jgi:hypothetical protein
MTVLKRQLIIGWSSSMKWSFLNSSSSFIKPPATGHHRWSGAGKKQFYGLHFYIKSITVMGMDVHF